MINHNESDIYEYIAMIFCFDFYAQKGAKRFYRGCKSVVIVVDSLIIFIPDGKGAVCVCVCVPSNQCHR